MIKRQSVAGVGRRVRYPALLATGALLAAAGGVVLGPASAQASPVDPGLHIYDDAVFAPFCSAARAVPGRRGWSRVTCAVGADQFVVPPGVHVLQVDVRGAAGGSGRGGAPGGAGERISAAITVAPGEVLEMAVGGAGDSHENGGVNGGGDGPNPGSTGRTASGGGGGASDIRVGTTGVWTRILVAAGGGGGGGASAAGRPGGNGGRNARPGRAAPGAPGTGGGAPTGTGSGLVSGRGGGSGARAGGAGSVTDQIGGAGGAGATLTPTGGDGGGGAGGYAFGGGGAGGQGGSGRSSGGGGGGGASSFVNPKFLQPGVPVRHLPGGGTGQGSITITFHAPPIQCGQTIDVSTTLTTNLDCRGRAGLTIGGQGDPLLGVAAVVLDLGGHIIRGDRGSTGIDVQHTDSTIQDGTLAGFGTAISAPAFEPVFEQGGPPSYTTVSGMRLLGGGTGIAIGASDPDAFPTGNRVTVSRTTIDGMSQDAIVGHTGGDGGLFLDHTTISRSAVGVWVTSDNVEARANVFTHNSGAALEVAGGGYDLLLQGNTVAGNGAGLLVDGTYTNDYAPAVQIVGNAVRGNAGPGIELTGQLDPPSEDGPPADGNVVSGNVTAGNSGAGIVVDLGSTAANLTVTGNHAGANGGWGIDAVGVVDGGGNVAHGNAGGQCRGVTCTG